MKSCQRDVFIFVQYLPPRKAGKRLNYVTDQTNERYGIADLTCFGCKAPTVWFALYIPAKERKRDTVRHVGQAAVAKS